MCPHRQWFVMQWHITDRCNLHCAHCYQDPCPGPELSFAALLRILDQYKALLDQLERHWGTPLRGRINVTGGEPFVRSDFLDFLQVLSSEKPRIVSGVLTNGSFIDRNMAKRLRKLGVTPVQVSMEGTQRTHDRIRGDGNHLGTVAAVRHLVHQGVPTTISFTANRLNYREFPEVARLACNLRAARVWSDRLIPMGRGCELETLTPEEAREMFRLMRVAREEVESSWFGRTKVSSARALQFLDGGLQYHCSAGGTLLTILPNGDLLPCRRMPIRVGNVMEQSLSELYFESPMLKALRDPNRVSKGCETCRFESHCRGGLRCLSYALTGDPFRADPGCWLAERCVSEGAV